MKNKCVFLDRDGVLNKDRPDYVYRIEDMIIPTGVVEALQALKAAGYLLIVITNQAGIAKGLYSRQDVRNFHQHFQAQCQDLLDDLYFSPHHPDVNSRSLTRKPDSLMLEKAMSKYNIDPNSSWMIGDKIGDVQAGQKAGVRTIQITTKTTQLQSNEVASDLHQAAQIICKNN